MNNVYEVNVVLEDGFDSFMRMVNTLRRRGVNVVSMNYTGKGATLCVPAEDALWMQSNLNKLSDVKVSA